ncbi:MAG TPA: bifunctional glutamate N-acetyltransferase/amino-acid acetyltransferase ArgJ [Dehalococcoidia bacterium]|nr:bifunctional glutamate N-acetyltransferase/amino-acid acetyltransferase ArgJ [Dehalococcoidia bacterium]
MEESVEFIRTGTVTAPEGFHAGAIRAGIKKDTGTKPDLGILFSEAPCVAGAVFTTNRIKAAPVVLTRRRLRYGKATAVVVNSGCANACTGMKGLRDAAKMAELAAEGLGVSPDDVVVASTGTIGRRLPMRRIQQAMDRIVLSRDGGHTLARAIMTTDTVPKEAAVAVRADDGAFVIGGIAKGSGMIHPNLATLLGLISTDAALELDFLRTALRKAVDVSFNMVSVDGDTSTNDMVLMMANGLADGRPIDQDSKRAEAFQQALERLCIFLAKRIAADGEGASRLIEVTVKGAASVAQARRAARTIISSSLVKTAVYGGDPNWGRIMAALGRSGAEVAEAKVDLYFGSICVASGGRSVKFNRRDTRRFLHGKEVPITLQLNKGAASATAWGCDLTKDYVAINSEYTT